VLIPLIAQYQYARIDAFSRIVGKALVIEST